MAGLMPLAACSLAPPAPARLEPRRAAPAREAARSAPYHLGRGAELGGTSTSGTGDLFCRSIRPNRPDRLSQMHRREPKLRYVCIVSI
eukprot:8994541-Pyramimonas_sp.AAC.1